MNTEPSKDDLADTVTSVYEKLRSISQQVYELTELTAWLAFLVAFVCLVTIVKRG